MIREAATSAVAIFGKSSETLLYGYYLQRFGINVDLFFSDPYNILSGHDHLCATWLCFNSGYGSLMRASRGVAELRELTLDSELRVVGGEPGTTIYETRPDHVRHLQQFADSCRRRGLLVDYTETGRQMGLPFGTLASARFPQDLSINPRLLARKLTEVFHARGGTVYYGRSFDEANRAYGTVVIEQADGLETNTGKPLGDRVNSSMEIPGRYLAFNQVARYVRFDDAAPVQAGCRRCEPVKAPVSLSRPSAVHQIRRSWDIAHWFANAKNLAEGIRHSTDQMENKKGLARQCTWITPVPW